MKTYLKDMSDIEISCCSGGMCVCRCAVYHMTYTKMSPVCGVPQARVDIDFNAIAFMFDNGIAHNYMDCNRNCLNEHDFYAYDCKPMLVPSLSLIQLPSQAPRIVSDRCTIS